MTDSPLRKCFVLMPFAEQFREVYDQIYKSVCEQNHIRCWRVDELLGPGSITRDIIRGILEADIIIADLTDRNPNVFYELGIAHSIGNKTIMTSQRGSDIPFDVGSYRIILYEQTITGSKKLSIELDNAIKELLKSLEQTNNPVQEVLASKTPLGLSKKTLLVSVFNVPGLLKAVRNFIAGERIIYTDDLLNVNLEEMKIKYSMGRDSLSSLVSAMLAKGIYRDAETLHDLVIKYRLDMGYWNHGRRSLY
jgi:hypothetical protein